MPTTWFARRRTPRRALAFLAPILFLASRARADDSLPQILIEPSPPSAPAVEAPPSAPAPSPPLPPTLRARWYGWQTLTVDGAAVLLVVSSTFTAEWGGIGGVATYVVGPPLVHIAHGHIGKGLADMGLRVGLPLLFGAIGYAAGDPNCHGDGFFCLPPAVGDAMIGGLIGYAGAVVVDAVLLAREDVEVPATPPPLEHASLKVVPDLQLRKDRQTVGLRGTF